MATATLPPLSPQSGGMCLAESSLQAADIIVSTTTHYQSRAIRAATGSAVSHALIYAGSGLVIEAVGDGVRHVPLSMAMADASLAVAYRHCRMTPAAASTVVQFALNQRGKKYDLAGAIDSVAARPGYRSDRFLLCTILSVKNCDALAQRANFTAHDAKKFFCSELVAEAYRRGGVALTEMVSQSVTPQEIVNVYIQGMLTYLGHIRH